MNYSEISYLFMQSIAILKPETIGKGRNKEIIVNPGNCFELCEFSFNELQDTTINVYHKRVKKYDWHYIYNENHTSIESKKIHYFVPQFHIEISGANFTWSFTSETILMVWGKIKKLIPKTDIYAGPLADNSEIKETFEAVKMLENKDIKLFKQVSKYTAKDELRPVMECIYLDGENITASDSHVLITKPFECSSEMLIPVDGQKFINRTKISDCVLISESENYLRFENSADTMTVKKVIGQYPKYKNVIPENNSYTAKVNRKDLIQAVKSQAKFANQGSKMIKLSFADKLEIEAQDIDFQISSKSVVYDCESDFIGEIGFKADYILLLLNSLADEYITFNCEDESRPTLINDLLIMPMMLQTYLDRKAFQPKQAQETELNELQTRRLKEKIIANFGSHRY